jgi:hypothetical protein
MKNIKEQISETTLNNFKESLNNAVKMPVFKTMIMNDDLKDAIERHEIQIINSIVNSLYGALHITSEKGIKDTYISSMSGIQEQLGRLPIETDKIRVLRGERYFTIQDNVLTSDVWFEILEEKING